MSTPLPPSYTEMSLEELKATEEELLAKLATLREARRPPAHQPPPPPLIIAGSSMTDDDFLLRLLHREEELRLSPAVQARFGAAERSGGTDWLEVAEELQRELLIEFGVRPTQTNLHLLRVAAARLKVSLYVRHNRASRGDLNVGDRCPDVSLVSYPGGLASRLSSFSVVGRPLIVLAGSFS